MTRDVRMIGFTLRLLGRSMRWVAPAILQLFWALVVLANPGPMLANAVLMFPMQAIVLCWLSVVIGNIDDDGHRELCTAIAGSPGRLLVDRCMAALVIAAVLGATITTALIVFSRPPVDSFADAVAVAVLELAGGVIGAGVGAVLHRPILRHVGITVVTATATLLVVIATPPATHLLREVNAGNDVAAYGLFGAAAVLAVLLVGLASRIVRPLAR